MIFSSKSSTKRSAYIRLRSYKVPLMALNCPRWPHKRLKLFSLYNSLEKKSQIFSKNNFGESSELLCSIFKFLQGNYRVGKSGPRAGSSNFKLEFKKTYLLIIRSLYFYDI